jgi:flavin reductase (DIM6/NTAB) family NADH-FMN oxidoreductase RutF
MLVGTPPWPARASEVELASLTPRPSTRVRVRRIAKVPVSLECRVLQIIPVGDRPSRRTCSSARS